MTFIGNAIFIFGLIRLIVSIVNRVAKLYLPEKTSIVEFPGISILIPARNEENNIGNLLDDLLRVKYRPLEILVYDDDSTDDTGTIVKEYADKYSHIRYVRGKGPEKGWLGKNFACHQLAMEAQGDYMMFIDADVQVDGNIIKKSLTYVNKYKLSLLSIFPTQIMPSLGSRLTVPIMNWILLSLLALPLVRKSGWTSFTAANGQFLLFNAVDYHRILPHLKCKASRVEDMAIMKEYKRKRLPVATLLGGEDISCRMYDTLMEGIEGFSKNVFQFFGGSRFLTFLFAIVTTLGPIYLFVFDGWLPGLIYILMMIISRVLISLSSRQPVLSNLLLIIPQHVVFWIIIFTACRRQNQKNLTWKDRNISL